MENKIVINVTSPSNEKAYVDEYKKRNPRAKVPNDGLDVSIVKLLNGTKGVALLPEKFNRSRDENPHRGQDFISLEELRKSMK